MRKAAFGKDFSLYLVAALAPQLIGFLLLPIFSRYLSAEEYALYALINMTTGIVGAVFSLQLPPAIFRFYFDQSGERLDVLLFNIMALLVVALAATGTAMSLFIDELGAALLHTYDPVQAPLFRLAILAAFVGILGQPGTLILRASRQTTKMMTFTLLAVGANMATSIVMVVVLKQGLWGYLIGNVAATVLTLGLYVPTYVNSMRLGLDLPGLRQALRYSLPLIPHALSGMIFLYSDRFILEKFVPMASVGIYVFADKIASGFKILVNQVGQAFTPYFFEDAAKDPAAAFARAARMSTAVATAQSAGVGAVALFAPEIVSVLFGDAYFECWKVLPILAVSYVFRGFYLFGSLNLFLEKRTRVVAAITFVSAAANIAFNMVFVRIYGIYAAAAATLLSFLVPPVAVALVDRRSTILRLNWRSDACTVAGLAAAVGFGYVLNLDLYATGASPALPLIGLKVGICLLFLGGLAYKERAMLRQGAVALRAVRGRRIAS